MVARRRIEAARLGRFGLVELDGIMMTPLSKERDLLIEVYTATNKPDEVNKNRELWAKYPAAKDAMPMRKREEVTATGASSRDAQQATHFLITWFERQHDA